MSAAFPERRAAESGPIHPVHRSFEFLRSRRKARAHLRLADADKRPCQDQYSAQARKARIEVHIFPKARFDPIAARFIEDRTSDREARMSKGRERRSTEQASKIRTANKPTAIVDRLRKTRYRDRVATRAARDSLTTRFELSTGPDRVRPRMSRIRRSRSAQ